MANKKTSFGSGPGSGKSTSLDYNPGAQGSVSFGKSFPNETKNVVSGKLPLKQTVANPKNAPINNKGNAGASPKRVQFGNTPLPKPAKNRVGFKTSS